MQLDGQEGLLSLDDLMRLLEGNADFLIDGVYLDLLVQEPIFNGTFVANPRPLDDQSRQEQLYLIFAAIIQLKQ